MSISCKFECQFEEIKSLNKAKINILPSRDKDGKWMPIVAQFECEDKSVKLHKILSKFYEQFKNQDELIRYGKGKIVTEETCWALKDLFPESINFGNLDSEAVAVETIWHFSDVEEIKS